MNTNPLLRLRELGQSIWLDSIGRGMLFSGEFASHINEDGILGVTSNPSIFEKAIVESHDYDDSIRAASLEGKTSKEIYEALTILDIQKAADLFYETFEKTWGQDGFVSLEVSPHLAYDTARTITEARKLWKLVARSNVLIKVPATAQGVPAIKQLISEGINVNVTLLFGLDRYSEVIEAYISGLEKRIAEGKSVMGITSVASFFLSRIDLAVDPLLVPDSTLRGQTAIASAKIAYQKYKSVFDSERFTKLKNQGAKTQRLLWASTSTKNANDSDIKYVEALIGPETIDTVPLKTLDAYRDHGDPASRLENGVSEACHSLELLSEMDIDLKKVTHQLEDDGVQKFSSAFDKLMTSLEVKRKETLADSDKNQSLTVTNCPDSVKKRIAQLNSENFSKRIWEKDPSLWKSDGANQAMIKKSLGWLQIAEKMEGHLENEIKEFAQEIRKSGFEHVVHMGMGGSSLAPLVFARTFSSQDGLPLTVLDTTDPLTIKKIEKSIPLERTLFIVASKSGTTAEPIAFKDYFYERVRLIKGEKVGENFIAITDPNTPLAKAAEYQRFRRIFLNDPEIGGRYSALSYFGLVPAALMGINISEILVSALESVHSSNTFTSSHNSPALVLGAVLGEMALQKRNKVTLLIEKPISTLGLWLEQLMAESTGKEGKGLVPISDEPVGLPAAYGEDRLFIYVTIKDTTCALKKTVSALKKGGQPVVTIELVNKFDVGQEFFQWEFATAVAGSIFGINAFNQPNVQESKDNTDRLLSQTAGHLNFEKPKLVEGSLSFYSDLNATSGTDFISQFIKSSKPGDYVALMAFLPEDSSTYKILQTIRKNLRDKLGYGPRFLHSTGQLHKGGPNTGLFIQLTANDSPEDSIEMSIPGKSYTFGNFKKAQAQGDLEALHKHGRRAIRIHLGGNIEKGLRELKGLVTSALRSK
jgi:transaldolase/glucose-6-phosphate isomerase